MTEINFCPVCGNELSDKTVEKCPSCGKTIRENNESKSRYVGFGTRFGAYIIDYIILALRRFKWVSQILVDHVLSRSSS